MALKHFYLAITSWLCCDFCGYRYYSREAYNNGIGVALVATICTMTVSWDLNSTAGLPTDDTGYRLIALSMVLWPGFLWGIAVFTLLKGGEGRHGCMWMVLSPLVVGSFGMSLWNILGGWGRHDSWRIVVGLSWIGIVIGHVLSQSRLGHTIEQHVSGLLGFVTPSPALQISIGAATMFASLASLVQSHSQTAKSLHQAKKKISDEALVPFAFPPFWGISGPLCIIIWSIGLALSISALETAEARAVLGSTSIATVLPMAFFPPFSGKIWGLQYMDYMWYLFGGHVCMASLLGLYHIFVAT